MELKRVRLDSVAIGGRFYIDDENGNILKAYIKVPPFQGQPRANDKIPGYNSVYNAVEWPLPSVIGEPAFGSDDHEVLVEV